MPLRKPWYSKNNTYGKIRAAAEAVAQNPNNNKLKNNLRNLVVRAAQGQNLGNVITLPNPVNNKTTNVNNRPKNVINSNGIKFAKKKNNKWYIVNGNGSNGSPYSWRANGQPYNKGLNNKFVPVSANNAAAAAEQTKINNKAGAGNKNGVTIGRLRSRNKNGLIGKAKVGNSIRNVYRQAGNYFSTAPNSTNVFRRIEPIGRFPSFSKQFKYVNGSPNIIKNKNNRFEIKNLTQAASNAGLGPPPPPSPANAKVNAFKTWWAGQTASGANMNVRARNYFGKGKNSNIWIPANATNMRAAAASNKNFWAAVNRLNETRVPPVISNANQLASATAAANAERLALGVQENSNANNLAAAKARANAAKAARQAAFNSFYKTLSAAAGPLGQTTNANYTNWANQMLKNPNLKNYTPNNNNKSNNNSNRQGFWKAVTRLRANAAAAGAEAAAAQTQQGNVPA